MRDELIEYFLRIHQQEYSRLHAYVELPLDLLWQATPEGVSLANLVCHVCEMEGFWIDWGLCGQEFARDREYEFTRHRDADADQLQHRLTERACKTRHQVQHVSDAQWYNERTFHGDLFTGAGILMWHIHHLGLHRGHVEAHVRWLRQV